MGAPPEPSRVGPLPFYSLLERLAWESVGRLPTPPTDFPPSLGCRDFPVCYRDAPGVLPPGFCCPLPLLVGRLDPPLSPARAPLRFHCPGELGDVVGPAPCLPLRSPRGALAPLKAKAQAIGRALHLPKEGSGDPERLGRPPPRSLRSSRLARKACESPLPGASGTPASGSNRERETGYRELLGSGSEPRT